MKGRNEFVVDEGCAPRVSDGAHDGHKWLL